MIRQYDFPRIFHNVVGQVIPLTVRNRENQRRPLDCIANLEEISSSNKSSSNPPAQAGILYVKSKKKKLVRRLKFNKTSSCFSMKQQKIDEDKLSQNDSNSATRNFLKKKQLTLQKTEKQSSRLQKDEIFEKTGTLDEQDEICSNVAQGQSSKRNINNFRLRTSFDQTGYEKQKIKDYPVHYKHRISQSNAIAISHPQMQAIRTKPKHKTYFKNDLISEEKSYSKIDESKQSQRKKSKKKTVNFIIEDEEEKIQKRVNSSKRGTRMQIARPKKSSNFNMNSKSPTPNHFSNKDFSDDEISNWSAKTVVSIKFSSNRNVHSKKTLRSQQSIFEDTNNSRYMIKYTSSSRPRTRTHIRFPQRANSFKNYKSLTSLSEVTIDMKSDWSIAKGRKAKRQQQQPTTNKSLTSSKQIEKKSRLQNKVSILIKSNGPFYLHDSQKNLDSMKNSTFQDLVFKKTTKMFKAARSSTQPDVFNELNNFHKFLNENSIEDNDHQLQKTLTKPIIIDSLTNHRLIFNPKIQMQQNLMIDMGLTLMKKMSILRQKKL